mmetsp:Transcript_10242/g.18447  ORF Transcript_10242/g.18447 Transcript_10242/m.18447 type:complete len:123 (+) Transcript_10242:58-426(+)
MNDLIEVEKSLSELVSEAEIQHNLVVDLEKEAASASSSSSQDTNAAHLKSCRQCTESITQLMLKLDGVQISRDAAADALRAGDRERAKKLTVLLTRRKKLVKTLNETGARADDLLQQLEARS